MITIEGDRGDENVKNGNKRKRDAMDCIVERCRRRVRESRLVFMSGGEGGGSHFYPAQHVIDGNDGGGGGRMTPLEEVEKVLHEEVTRMNEEGGKGRKREREREREREVQHREDRGYSHHHDTHDGDSDDNEDDHYHFPITEEDIQSMLKEVDDEIRKEELLVQGYEESLRLEREEIDGMVEEWDVSGEGDEAEEEGGGGGNCKVLCPVCSRRDLIQTDRNVIMCKTPGCLRVDVVNEGLTLNDLRQNLSDVVEEHGRSCGEKMKFVMREEWGISICVGTCKICQEEFVVL